MMIEKFAGARGLPLSEFLDLNHTSNSMLLVSLMIPKFARNLEFSTGELRNRDTSCVRGYEWAAAVGEGSEPWCFHSAMTIRSAGPFPL